MKKGREQIYDELIVIKCLQGQEEAFEELVQRFQKRLWNYAFKVTGSESAAWDIVQETWIGVIKGLKKLEDLSLFRSWIYRILNNKCADFLRKQQAQIRLNNKIAEDTISEKNTDTNEETEILYKAIMGLLPEQRALLMLRFHENFDINEISKILKIPAGTVKSKLHRTVTELRNLVERTKK